jgi:hypothetical protein
MNTNRDKTQLVEFIKQPMTVKYLIFALIALAFSIKFLIGHYSAENILPVAPLLTVLISVYFALKDRVIVPLALGTLMSFVLVMLIPQMQTFA